jgi:hypothetical protein
MQVLQTQRAMARAATRPSEKRFWNYLLFAEYEEMLKEEQYLQCYRELRLYTYTTANSMYNTTTTNIRLLLSLALLVLPLDYYYYHCCLYTAMLYLSCYTIHYVESCKV